MEEFFTIQWFRLNYKDWSLFCGGVPFCSLHVPWRGVRKGPRRATLFHLLTPYLPACEKPNPDLQSVPWTSHFPSQGSPGGSGWVGKYERRPHMQCHGNLSSYWGFPMPKWRLSWNLIFPILHIKHISARCAAHYWCGGHRGAQSCTTADNKYKTSLPCKVYQAKYTEKTEKIIKQDGKYGNNIK